MTKLELQAEALLKAMNDLSDHLETENNALHHSKAIELRQLLDKKLIYCRNYELAAEAIAPYKDEIKTLSEILRKKLEVAQSRFNEITQRNANLIAAAYRTTEIVIEEYRKTMEEIGLRKPQGYNRRGYMGTRRQPKIYSSTTVNAAL